MKKWMPIVLLFACLPLMSQEIAVKSQYLEDPIEGAHQITIVGALSGSGTLFLDENLCYLDRFGDPTICNLIPPEQIKIEINEINIKDPKKENRRLYELKGDFKSNMQLVVPEDTEQYHRLIVDNKRILLLEPVPKRLQEKGPAVLCFQAKYEAVQRNGSVILRARGMHPSKGWRAYFEILPSLNFPPNHYRLVCEQPIRPSSADPTPFEVSLSFRSNEILKELIIHDARGQHEVEVK